MEAAAGPLAPAWTLSTCCRSSEEAGVEQTPEGGGESPKDKVPKSRPQAVQGFKGHGNNLIFYLLLGWRV